MPKTSKLGEIDIEMEIPKPPPKFMQDMEIVFDLLRSSKIVKRIRKAFDIPVDGMSLYDTDKNGEVIEETVSRDVVEWEKQLSPKQKKEFEKRVQFLMKKLRIPYRFTIVVGDFIKLGEIFTDSPYVYVCDALTWDVHLDVDRHFERPIVVTLAADVKKTDLESKKLWDMICFQKEELAKLGKGNTSRSAIPHSLIPHYAEMKQIYQWRSDGMSYQEIRERARDELNWSLGSEQHAAIIVHRYKNLNKSITRRYT